jgi:hypothetical protein
MAACYFNYQFIFAVLQQRLVMVHVQVKRVVQVNVQEVVQFVVPMVKTMDLNFLDLIFQIPFRFLVSST